jgi:hypothetical protein
MAKKKEETTMLVRSVALDVSERVGRYCRREGIKRREFVERAIDVLEGQGQGNEHGVGHEDEIDEKKSPLHRVDQIAEQVKAYSKAIRLRKELMGILGNLKLLGDWNTQSNAYLEVTKMANELSELISKTVPDHKIPNDREARKAMGLPREYCFERVDITEEQWRETQMRNAEIAENSKKTDKQEGDELSRSVKKIFEEAREQLRKKGELDTGEPPEESVVPPLGGEEKVQSPTGAPPSEHTVHARMEEADPPKKKAIKTSVFGRGFPGVDEE